MQAPTLRLPVFLLATIAATIATVVACGGSDNDHDAQAQAALVEEGKRIFRFDTFGDEVLWTDTLHMDEVVESKVDPTTALSVGLKVDADALPPGILGKVDLKSPATTVALLKMNAVVGLQATVDADNHITRLGVTCALCHSTVDDSLAPGIGHRKDGWPNRDLNVGAIIALSPALPADKKAVYNSWGPGKYDPRFNIDGLSTPLLLPPAYGLAVRTRATAPLGMPVPAKPPSEPGPVNWPLLGPQDSSAPPASRAASSARSARSSW